MTHARTHTQTEFSPCYSLVWGSLRLAPVSILMDHVSWMTVSNFINTVCMWEGDTYTNLVIVILKHSNVQEWLLVIIHTFWGREFEEGGER